MNVPVCGALSSIAIRASRGEAVTKACTGPGTGVGGRLAGGSEEESTAATFACGAGGWRSARTPTPPATASPAAATTAIRPRPEPRGGASAGAITSCEGASLVDRSEGSVGNVGWLPERLARSTPDGAPEGEELRSGRSIIA